MNRKSCNAEQCKPTQQMLRLRACRSPWAWAESYISAVHLPHLVRNRVLHIVNAIGHRLAHVDPLAQRASMHIAVPGQAADHKQDLVQHVGM